MEQTAERVALNPNPKTGPERFFKVQIKAWTRFDPSTMGLAEIADKLAHGGGMLTVIEVVKIADNLSGVDDAEVRDRLDTVLAVERVLQKVNDIPEPLREKLHALLAKPDGNKRQAA